MIIGLTGPAGVGKTTMANALVEYLNHYKLQAVRSSFAQPLKDELYYHATNYIDLVNITHIPMDSNAAEGYDAVITDPELIYQKPTAPLVRRLLQWYGTEVKRSEDPNYWLKIWVNNLPSQYEIPHVIVDDVRFENEAKLVEAFGGQVVMLVRPIDLSAPAHASEDFSWFGDRQRYALQSPEEPYMAHNLLKWLDVDYAA